MLWRKEWSGSLVRPTNWELLEVEDIDGFRRLWRLWAPHIVAVRWFGAVRVRWMERNITETPW